MKGVTKDATKEFMQRLVFRGLSEETGCCRLDLKNGLAAVVEPRMSYRNGGVTFNCALGIRNWRHQNVIDRSLRGLTRGVIAVREGFHGVWYPYFSFGADWYGYIDAGYKTLYLEEIDKNLRVACEKQADYMVDSIMPIALTFATVDGLTKLPQTAIFAGGPIDIALPLLAAFENRRDDLESLLDRMKGRGSWLSPESSRIFSARMNGYFKENIFQKVLSLESKREIDEFSWPGL